MRRRRRKERKEKKKKKKKKEKRLSGRAYQRKYFYYRNIYRPAASEDRASSSYPREVFKQASHSSFFAFCPLQSCFIDLFNWVQHNGPTTKGREPARNRQLCSAGRQALRVAQMRVGNVLVAQLASVRETSYL